MLTHDARRTTDDARRRMPTHSNRSPEWLRWPKNYKLPQPVLYKYNLGSYWSHAFSFCYGTSNALVFPFEVKCKPSILNSPEQIWINFTQTCFVISLLEIGLVVPKSCLSWSTLLMAIHAIILTLESLVSPKSPTPPVSCADSREWGVGPWIMVRLKEPTVGLQCREFTVV